MQQNNQKQYSLHDYIFEDFDLSDLNTPFILKHCSEQIAPEQYGFFDLHPQSITLNTATFVLLKGSSQELETSATLKSRTLTLSCTCPVPKRNLCAHQAQVLFNILWRTEIRLFFDVALRQTKMKQEAVNYGLENERHLDDYFQLLYLNKSIEIKPKLKELFPVNKLTDPALEAQIFNKQEVQLPGVTTQKENAKMILVIGQHRFYKHLSIELFEAQVTKKGKVKNPLNSINPQTLIWKTESNEVVRFLTAVSNFQKSYDTEVSQMDIEALKALVKNPLELEVFYHDIQISENITATSIVPVELTTFAVDLRLSVHARDNFYEVSGQIMVGNNSCALDKINLQYHYFLLTDHALQLIDNYDFLRVIDFFKQYGNKLLVHTSKFEAFRENMLSKLEHKIHIDYAYLKPATKAQIQESDLERSLEKLIYLSESEDYILITPTMKYGEIEIPVFSKKQLYAFDIKGDPYTIPRNEEAEQAFINILLKQHDEFQEQYNIQLNRGHFYLHKNVFLEADWFLEAYEIWQKQEIAVLGFNAISGNRYNPNKAMVSVNVNSGINWFDTNIDVEFGNQKVALKHLQKAVKNKNRFVQLGDGTVGILPTQWIEKFAAYFHSGELLEDRLRTPKVRFSDIATLYEEKALSGEVKMELALLRSKIADFEAITEVEVPADLKATLRDYQKQGLNWLNFLDEFNFGGCLADDMGLGKTIQVIAFILSQRSKNRSNTNLVVVPTSLIFNWQAEVKRYAPSINLLTIHGANRSIDLKNLKRHEIVLTTYGTLLSDVHLLKKYTFNYVFLDESQAIKNPESLRYKATCLLKSRNKIVLSGTPIENNTFDLFGQLSFACPGLLGTKRYFKQHYSTPIDQFHDRKRALELQQKISPFVLRRTKEQVAKELPDKTEMILYCEMGPDQRKVYDAYARQFRDLLEHKKDDEIAKYSLHVLQGFTKLRQICNSPALLADEEFYGDASSKVEVLMEQIEAKSPHHKILVFSQFVSMLELIKKELERKHIAHQYLTGQTKDRATEVRKFQSNPEVRVFLISLKAGGTGLNLTEADYVYLIDPWWNPAVENQAIDRSHRIGQKKNTVAVRLICPDTIEEKMVQLQESKKTLAKNLVRTDGQLLKSLSKKELLTLFS